MPSPFALYISLPSIFPADPSKKPCNRHSRICCGPRGNRGPILRGRVLSSEAILAVQALKRFSAAASDSDDIQRLLSRLVKTDLLASLRELLRQNHCRLALDVFSTVRRETWYRTDYSLYAEIISALARNDLVAEIDRLVDVLLSEGFYSGDSRGLGRLLRTLVAADRTKAVIDVYRLMKSGGCVPDEFMYKVLTKGLRRLGEFEIADEIENDYSSIV